MAIANNTSYLPLQPISESPFLGSWERLDDRVAARVAVYRPYDKGDISEATPEREALFAWIAKSLTTFRAIAKKYLVDGQTV